MVSFNCDIDVNAVKNVVVQNLANEVFYVAFDTKLGREEFKGTDRQQVVKDAATRIKRVTHVR